jgi:hypothetical protein
MKILRHALQTETQTDAEVFLVQSDYNLSRTEECFLEVLVSVSIDKRSNLLASMYTMYDSRLIDPDDETDTMDELFDLLVELGGTEGRKTSFSVPPNPEIPHQIIFDLVEKQIEGVVRQQIFEDSYGI